jgi:arsenate reductase
MPAIRFGVPVLAGLFTMTLPAAAQTPPPPPKPASPVSTALEFAHAFASPHALTPAKDRELKVKLTVALAKSRELTWDVVRDSFDEAAFRSLAGGGASITVEKMEQLVRAKTPPSRNNLNPTTRQHADLLAAQLDLIEEQHRKPAEELVEWVVKNYQPGKQLGVIAVCTGNTRRSMLSATMGNVAAAYHGLDVRFYSGGTDPDAFNPRSIATLKAIGVEIEPTGKEAGRGKKGDPNPIYAVRWGKGLETTEFSKVYTDAHNPQTGFAAILVCSEADSACPKVVGVSARIPVPYLDPKAFDGAPFEAGKYAERRDDIGRFMLSVMMQSRRRLEFDGKLK